ncbi:MAG: 2-oxo acid dehydrogenase subunit E2 [Alicyclobacillus sp.]|nr:2-oxo acid dehydrogenase subunit E2 [Alicyclobacillus sp.]
MPDVRMPQLGESVTEGTLSKWLKRAGEHVARYEPLAEVITDKVTAEVPSDYEGVLAEVFVTEGQTVRVGTPLCRIEDGRTDRASKDRAAVRSATSEPGPAQVSAAAPLPAPAGAPGGRYSPAVRRLAEEHGVDLHRLHGSGEGGRITRKDVLAYIAAQAAQPSPPPVPAPAVPPSPAPHPGLVSDRSSAVEAGQRPPTAAAPPAGRVATVSDSRGPDDTESEVIPLSQVRQAVARRMLESKHSAPHAWTMMEADVSKLVALRQRVKQEFKRREGIDLTFLPFFIKSVVEALKRYPLVNASWDNGQILVHKRIHISIAVAADDGLYVPVIHDADRLSIAGLAHAVNDLAARARSGRLTPADVSGGTFTVNNTGSFGSVLSQPILNPPQAALLSFEAIVKRPVVVADAIAIRDIIHLCLSLDHRVLDGWLAGGFLRAVKERLESFDENTAVY